MSLSISLGGKEINRQPWRTLAGMLLVLWAACCFVFWFVFLMIWIPIGFFLHPFFMICGRVGTYRREYELNDEGQRVEIWKLKLDKKSFRNR